MYNANGVWRQSVAFALIFEPSYAEHSFVDIRLPLYPCPTSIYSSGRVFDDRTIFYFHICTAWEGKHKQYILIIIVIWTTHSICKSNVGTPSILLPRPKPLIILPRIRTSGIFLSVSIDSSVLCLNGAHAAGGGWVFGAWMNGKVGWGRWLNGKGAYYMGKRCVI